LAHHVCVSRGPGSTRTDEKGTDLRQLCRNSPIPFFDPSLQSLSRLVPKADNQFSWRKTNLLILYAQAV
jgi:hypothetical protein